MWMFLPLTCTYLIQISSFPNQMTPKKVNQDLIKYKYDLLTLCFSITYPTKGSRELEFLKYKAYNIQWDDIKHTSMRPLAFA